MKSVSGHLKTSFLHITQLNVFLELSPQHKWSVCQESFSCSKFTTCQIDCAQKPVCCRMCWTTSVLSNVLKNQCVVWMSSKTSVLFECVQKPVLLNVFKHQCAIDCAQKPVWLNVFKNQCAIECAKTPVLLQANVKVMYAHWQQTWQHAA